MKADEILSSEDFKKCLDFHGHICPGIAIGYRAAKAGLEWYKKNGSKADPMVAIVETGGCSADMFQVLAGCTFGNGGLVHKDNGKQVFNLVGRHSQSGVLLADIPKAASVLQ
jgi:formylmethanofuran dehydrogenase subunit E